MSGLNFELSDEQKMIKEGVHSEYGGTGRIETLGGNGFSEENALIYMWEAARLLRTAPVSKEMILNYISEHVLGLPRSY